MKNLICYMTAALSLAESFCQYLFLRKPPRLKETGSARLEFSGVKLRQVLKDFKSRLTVSQQKLPVLIKARTM
ncbi:MAG: hypothetical protein WKF71_05230 [Pyrinomonadaceae bacterium]